MARGAVRRQAQRRPGTVARVYAETLHRLAAREAATEAVTADLNRFVGALESSRQLRRFLEAPQIAGDDKQAVLDRAFGDRLHPLVLRFLHLLVDKHRETLVVEITAAWTALLDEKANRRSATVTTAVPPEPAMLEAVRRALEAATGKTIALEARLDPSILGGLVIRTGDLVMDASVRSRVAALRHRLMSTDARTHQTPIGGTA